jgi:hypothetical protein
MKYFTPWRWNPIRGEYESGPPPRLKGSGEISAIDAFRARTILLLGGTGFVGKVLLAMLLDRFPKFGESSFRFAGKKMSVASNDFIPKCCSRRH